MGYPVYYKKPKIVHSFGCDNIPISFIKDGPQELSTPLMTLINLCLRQSIFPDAEKLANVTPVFKSGDRSIMDDYRPSQSYLYFQKLLNVSFTGSYLTTLKKTVYFLLTNLVFVKADQPIMQSLISQITC